jgi:hypothetical protein
MGVEMSRISETARLHQTTAGWWLAAYAAFAVAIVLRDQLNNRAERRIGAKLQHRASRSTAVSIPTMLGTARMTFLVAALTLEAGFAVTLLAIGHGWLAWAFPLAFAVACGFVVVGARHAATRATVAIDPVSLTVDERLRSQDAFSATLPLLFLVGVLIAGNTRSAYGPGWLDDAALLGGWVILALRLWGEISGPGHPSAIRLDSFLARAQRRVRP